MPERFVKPSPLSNPQFQKFLIDQGSMVLVDDLESKEWVLRSSSRKSVKREALWSRLTSNPGCIVPAAEIIQETKLLRRRNPLKAAYDLGYETRRFMDDPDSFFVAFCGQGLGVKSLYPVQEDMLDRMYPLWQSINKFVSAKVLSERVVGISDHQTVMAVVGKFNELIEKVSFNSAKIESGEFNNKKFYRLKLLNQEPEEQGLKSSKEPRAPFLGIYQREYQDWLGKVKILNYIEGFRKIELKEGENLTANEKKIVNLLMRYTGYMVPKEKIVEMYYKEEPEDWERRLRANLVVIRQKCVNPEAVFTSRGSGWGVGIESLKLPVSALRPLYCLWQNQDEFVQVGDRPDNPTFSRHALAYLQKLLSTTPHIVGSKDGQPGLHILINRDNLVDRTAV